MSGDINKDSWEFNAKSVLEGLQNIEKRLDKREDDMFTKIDAMAAQHNKLENEFSEFKGNVKGLIAGISLTVSTLITAAGIVIYAVLK